MAPALPQSMLGLIRSLRRSRGYTALVIGTASLALGLSTVVFGTLNAILRPASPFRDGEKLFVVYAAGSGLQGNVRSIDRLRAITTHVPSLAGASVGESDRALIEVGSAVSERRVFRVASDYFALLGASASAGRLFSAGDTLSAGKHIAVVSDGFWRGVLGGRPLERGVPVTIDGVSYTVVGVASPGVGGVLDPDAWLLASSTYFETAPTFASLHAVVRLTPEASRLRLDDDLRTAASRLQSSHGNGRVAFRFMVQALESPPVAIGEIHVALIAAAGAILLIACANLANLSLARAVARRPTFALRRAVGATRWRIVSDVIGECVLLSLCGGAAGGLVALASVGPLRRLIPPAVGLDIQLDWVVFAFTLMASLATAVAFGLWPALRASNADPASVLKETSSATTVRRGPYYSFVVAVEVAVALAVATSACLLLRASTRVGTIDFGHDRSGLLKASIYLPRRLDSASYDVARLTEQLQEGIARLPGVLGSTWWAPPLESGLAVHASHDGTRPALYNPLLRSVSWDYLPTLGIAVLDGRDFLPGDREGPGVAIIDELAARQLWPHQSAIGQQLSVAIDGPTERWITVVGIAKRVRQSISTLDAFDAGPPAIYLSTPPIAGGREIVVRTTDRNEGRMLSFVGALVRDVAPTGTYASFSSFSEETRLLTKAHRFIAGTFVAFALCALGLCVLGLYSVLSYAVLLRSREYAVRLALGGTPGQVFRLVAREGAVLVLTGTALGALLSFLVAPLVDPFLYDVYRVDAASLVGAELVVIICACLACAAPAVRARRTSPSVMLRV